MSLFVIAWLIMQVASMIAGIYETARGKLALGVALLILSNTFAILIKLYTLKG